VVLDPSLTKAELVAQAEALAVEDAATAPGEALLAEPDSTIPTDLLG
jgi:hypothetical protein